MAQRDSFVVERLRAAGAVLIGLTNMPPMANGGMQRGVYGRAESPYNADYLTAPFASGSSNGSGTATAASFCAFGIGEETWSSGRGPASNNALCAYTPSRGVISTRGGWPLVPTMDVVVPHTRSMADLLEVLDVVVAEDPDTRGDFWRLQPWVPLPRVDEVRPPSYPALADRPGHVGRASGSACRGCTSTPTRTPASAPPGIGGPTGRRIDTRPSVLDLFDAVRRDLLAAGAEVVDVDFPVVSNYEGDRAGAPTIATRGLVEPRVPAPRDRRPVGVGVGRLPRRQRRSRAQPARRRRRQPDLPAPRRAHCPTGTTASTTTSRSIRRSSATTRSTPSSASRPSPRACTRWSTPGRSTSRSGWTAWAWTP